MLMVFGALQFLLEFIYLLAIFKNFSHLEMWIFFYGVIHVFQFFVQTTA